MSHAGSGTCEEESVIRGKVMKLKDIGEHELIQRFFKIFSVDPGSEINLYPHDDCAVIDFNDKYLLLTTDIINERTHIPEGASGYQVVPGGLVLDGDQSQRSCCKRCCAAGFFEFAGTSTGTRV
jgi:hypothetical protein